MTHNPLSKLSRYEICQQAEEAVASDDVSFLHEARDWINSDDAIMLANNASEQGALKCFRYLVENLTTPKNRTSHLTSFLCHAADADQENILQEFVPLVAYNMVSMSKILTHIIRYNAEKCFDVVLSQPSLPPSVIPTAFFAVLEMGDNANKNFLKDLYPRLDTVDMCSVFVARFDQIVSYHDMDSVEFLDNFIANIPASQFEEVYPHIHRFTKDCSLPNVLARNSKIQLSKMLAPSMESKKASVVAPRSGRKM